LNNRTIENWLILEERQKAFCSSAAKNAFDSHSSRFGVVLPKILPIKEGGESFSSISQLNSLATIELNKTPEEGTELTDRFLITFVSAIDDEDPVVFGFLHPLGHVIGETSQVRAD